MQTKSGTKIRHNVTHVTGRNTRPETKKRKIRKCQNCRKKVDRVWTLFNGKWKMRMCYNCKEYALKNGWRLKEWK